MKLPTPTTISRRLTRVGPLQKGSHPDHKAMCIMEAVAFVAGEPWSDAPTCASLVISAFLRSWNESLDDERRDALLRPFIPKLIGTSGARELENRRANMAVDWLVRVHTPAWLKLAGLTVHAEALASLPEITDFAKCPSLMPVLNAARTDAAATKAAAGAEPWIASLDATWAAGWGGVKSANRAANRIASDANRSAASEAASEAARAAAWGAVGVALKPTVKELQKSALMLVERMIEARAEAQS